MIKIYSRIPKKRRENKIETNQILWRKRASECELRWLFGGSIYIPCVVIRHRLGLRVVYFGKGYYS